MAHHCLDCGTRIPSSDWHCTCKDCRAKQFADKMAESGYDETIKMLEEERDEQDRNSYTVE